MEEEEDQEDQTSSTLNSKSRRRIVELTRNSKSTEVKIVDRSTSTGRPAPVGLPTDELQ